MEQFRDLSHGRGDPGGLVYFVALAAAVLYLCVGSRGGGAGLGQGAPLLGAHYAVRALSLVLAACRAHRSGRSRLGARIDVTSEQVHSLSDDTRKLIALDRSETARIYSGLLESRKYRGVTWKSRK